MVTDRFSIHVPSAHRVRAVLLLLAAIAILTVWEIGSAWRWYEQSLATLATVLVLYSLLYLVQVFGNLSNLLPGQLSAVLLAGPRPLISPTSVVLLGLSILLFLTSLCSAPSRSARGYNLRVYSLQSSDAPVYETTLPDSVLQAFDLPYLLHNPSRARVHVLGYVLFPSSSAYKPRLYSSSGESQLLVDGLEAGSILEDPANRVTVPTLEVSKGWHRVDIIHTTSGTPPTLDLKWEMRVASDYRPIQVQSAQRVQECVQPWRYRVTRVISSACFALSALLLISTLVSWFRWHSDRIRCVPTRLDLSILLALCVTGAAWGRWILLKQTGAPIEADEAAFGVMAQRLLRGELPPIFHYGQPYQGTLEVIPLALLLSLFGASPMTLKLEPWILYTLFSILLLLLYRRICSLAETFVLLGMLVCSPFLLMWISLKAWFGYVETLCSSAVILACTYKLVFRTGPRDRYWVLLLGLASGISLYILPSALPVVISSFVFLVACRRTRRWQPILFAAAIMLVTALPPYVAHDLTSDEKSISYLMRGRRLGPPRVAGERPFTDRFLNECLPVVLGGRTTYDQQHDLPANGLPRLLYFITLTGAFFLLVDLREDCKSFLRGQSPGRLLFVLPAVLAIPIGVFSPFGIWPWYFLQLYLGLPLVWASFLKFSFRHARPIGIAGVLVCLGVWAAGSTSRPDLMFQPASLVQSGIILREDNTPVIDALLQRGIDHVLCDQGGDFTDQSTGRDWIGERLTYESGLRITAIDSLTRRHPHLFADTMTADRVAYLFRRTFLFWDFSHAKDPGYRAISFEMLARLFGPEYLNYTRVDLGDDVLFVPEPDHPSNGKGLWLVKSNREPWFLYRLHDHTISARVYGPTYWSSGADQSPGDYIEIDTGRIMPMRGVVMYHGPKSLDRPRAAQVSVSQDREKWWLMGRTSWDASTSVTYWRHTESFQQRYVRIEVTEPSEQPGAWWTIYELWII